MDRTLLEPLPDKERAEFARAWAALLESQGDRPVQWINHAELYNVSATNAAMLAAEFLAKRGVK